MPPSTTVNAAIPVDLTEFVAPSYAELAEQIDTRREGFDVRRLFFVVITRGDERLTLVLDAGWVRLLQDIDAVAPDVVPQMTIPATALAAILPVWPGDFLLVHPLHCHWTERHDGVLIAHVDDHTGLSFGAGPR
ncbi:MAG: hypothetical protein R2733_16365 [Acidimicrobiales bacterium]